MTPRQFDLCVQHDEWKIRRDELMLAQVCSSIVNFGYARPKEAVGIESFMPSENFGHGKKRTKDIDVCSKKHHQKLAAQVEAIFGSMMQVNERGKGRKLS
jgi:hypothetical protein